VPSYLPAFGQTETSLDVLAPEIEDFPVVSIQFKLDSKFVPDGTGLQTEQLTVLENEKPAQGLSLAKEYAGVYFILAINGARDLDLRDTFGISVYEKLSDGLIAWAFSRHDNFQDTWSLVNNEGTGIHNLDSPDDWVKALGDYQSDWQVSELFLLVSIKPCYTFHHRLQRKKLMLLTPLWKKPVWQGCKLTYGW